MSKSVALEGNQALLLIRVCMVSRTWTLSKIEKTLGFKIYSFRFYIPYFSIDNAHLMYNAHPKLFRHSF